MRWFTRKVSLTWDVIGCIAFAAFSILNFYEYFNEEPKNIKLLAGVVFGLLSVMKLTDVIGHLRKRRKQLD